MSFIADAHRDWHVVYGQNVVCPLDCGVGEAEAEDAHEAQMWAEEQAAKGTIRCAHCKSKHIAVSDVRMCAASQA